MQHSSMSPPDMCRNDPDTKPLTTASIRPVVDNRHRAEKTQESMLYQDMTDLNEKLELQNKLINSLEGENRLLKMQLSTKENEILTIKKEKEQLQKQLTEARLKLQHHENVNNTSNGICKPENCMNLKMLMNLNLETKTEDISVQIKESENLAQDLHLKLGKVLVALNALGSGIALLQPKEIPKQSKNPDCILGPSDGEVLQSSLSLLEPPEIKIEIPEIPPAYTSCQILSAIQDASSSSSADIRDSLEVILQSLPPSNPHQTNSTQAPALSDQEDTQISHAPSQDLIELKCIVCKLNFKFPKDQVPLSVQTKDTFKCAVCKKQEFRRSAKSNKIFKCTICNKVFHFPSKLKNHLRTHTGEKPFHCNVCGKSFSLSFNLKIHYRTHSGERPFACQVCGKNFRQSKSLLYHSCSHSLSKSPIPCKTCKKTFEPDAYGEHPCVQAQTNQNQYSCKFCGKNFQSLAMLSAHVLTHGEKQSYSCDSCGEAFSLRTDLKRHWCAGTYKQTEGQSSSTSVESEYFPESRIFKCVVCGETFTESAQILKHQLIHQSENSQNTSIHTGHGPKRFSVPAVGSNVDSSARSPINLGKKQVPDIIPTKNLSSRLLTRERKRDAKHDRSPHQQPEFYDISELAMLKSYSDSSTL